MKSLNKTFLENNRPEIFDEKIMNFLSEEGFKGKTNDSYVYAKHNPDCFEEKCLMKSIYCEFDVNIYIFTNGIGVDIDYSCGGNSSTHWYPFSTPEEFENAYDSMVDLVEKYK